MALTQIQYFEVATYFNFVGLPWIEQDDRRYLNFVKRWNVMDPSGANHPLLLEIIQEVITTGLDEHRPKHDWNNPPQARTWQTHQKTKTDSGVLCHLQLTDIDSELTRLLSGIGGLQKRLQAFPCIAK